MKKYVIPLFLVAVFIIGQFLFHYFSVSLLSSSSPPLLITSPVNPTSSPLLLTTYRGVLVKNNPGLKKDTWYLITEQPGKPAISFELNFTPDSSCLGSSCSAARLEAGQHVEVTGELKAKLLTVQSLKISPLATAPSPSFNPDLIDWTLAQDYLRDCSIIKIVQFHSKKVNLTHKDGRNLTFTEPQLDDVIKAMETNAAKCGRVSVITQ